MVEVNSFHTAINQLPQTHFCTFDFLFFLRLASVHNQHPQQWHHLCLFVYSELFNPKHPKSLNLLILLITWRPLWLNCGLFISSRELSDDVREDAVVVAGSLLTLKQCFWLIKYVCVWRSHLSQVLHILGSFQMDKFHWHLMLNLCFFSQKY